MSKKYNLYLGKAGQFAIMSEFLSRGWNTSIPDVDVGDDILVVEDKKGEFKRVQVKTATANVKESGYSVKFNIPLKQLSRSISPEIHYVFMTRHEDMWVNVMIVQRKELYDFFKLGEIGSANGDNLTLYLTFRNHRMMCKKVDFAPFLNDFSSFPKIPH